MSMKVSLRDGPDGVPVVDLDAELFEDIPSDLYVSTMRIRKKQVNVSVHRQRIKIEMHKKTVVLNLVLNI